MSDSNVQIELKNVSITFKQRKSFFRHHYHSVLKSVSFSINKGETLGIVGRNGCGKSTLLKVIAGILEPDSGFCERKADKISLQSLAAGFDEELSGRDNAIIASMLLGHTRKSAIENLEQINAFSELNAHFDHPIKTYSSGMRARLGFSVALTMNADVLLIDEVLGVGDESFRVKAERALTSKMSSSQTVVFVSHSIGQVASLCDRVIWLENGQVKMVGEPEAITSQYLASN